ncbi:MAG: hypothetical protein ABI663_02520 [Chryseolinea sp.]
MSKSSIFRAESLRQFAVFVFLLLVSLSIAYTTGAYGIKVGIGIVALIASLVIVFCIFYRYKFGFYVLLVYSHFMFLIGSFVTLPIPLGTIIDAILVLILLAVLVHRKYQSTTPIKKEHPFKNVVGTFVIISVVFDLIQVLNPISPLSIGITLLELRESLYLILIFFISFKIFDSYKAIVNYTLIWVFLSLLVAGYGLFQEFAGLRDFEWQFLRSDPRRFELYFIWGRVRKWSFLSDPSVFGMQMAFCGIFCFIIALGKFPARVRLISLVVAVISMMSMSYSGTRTAVGMVPLGIALYFLMTLNNPKMLVAAILTGLIFLAVIFGPFYGSTANRIRSTFNKDDPSMSLRDGKRDILQGHIMHNPLGSGLGTANGVAKRLTVTADTDSGYLRTAVDKGIPGLIIQLGLYCSVMIIGIRAYYRSRNSRIKSLYAAYLSAFFAITFANFYQDASDQKPLNILMIAVFSIMLRLEKTDDQPELS